MENPTATPHPFINALKSLQNEIHETAKAKGWWDKPEWFQFLEGSVLGVMPPHLVEAMEKAAARNQGETIALMHAELSEGLEGVRAGNPPSDHIPEFSALEEEYADTVIRILDDSEAKGLRIAEAIIAKMEFNKSRPFKHGGKKF
jgi:hypothetical protein